MSNFTTFNTWYAKLKENEVADKTITADISTDVDTIINSLETLANELSEDLNALSQKIENALIEDYETVNEAEEGGFLANIMKMVKSMKAYATLKSTYPKFKELQSDAETNKIIKLGEFDLAKDEMEVKELEKVKNKFKEALSKVSDSDMPTAKKKAAKEKIRQMRDEAFKAGSSTVNKKITAARAQLELQLTNVIRDAKADIDAAIADNEITSDILKARWTIEKLDIDDRFAYEQIDKNVEAELQFAEDNPETQQKLADKQKKGQLAVKKESAEKKAELEGDLKELEDEQDALANSGDEKQKEANSKIKEFYKSGREYVSILNSTFNDDNSSTDLAPDEKKVFTDARKAYNAAKGAISPSTFKSSDPNLNDDDAEEMFTTFTEMVQKQVDEYKTKANAVRDEKPQQSTQKTKSAEAVATEALGDAKSEYTKITAEQEGETIEVPAAEEGGEPTTKPKWTDIKKFKGKDAEGADTEEEVIYAKENSNESRATVTGTKLNEYLITRAIAIGLNELATEIKSKHDWQLYEGSALAANYIAMITKAESDQILNESKYQNLSIKEKFSRLM